MQETIDSLERLFHEKILLYQDIKECLKRERDCLLRTDIDGLWQIAEEKHSIVSGIEGVRGRIMALLSGASTGDGMSESSFIQGDLFSLIPKEHRGRFKMAYLSLAALKDEIRQMGLENRLFIQESLDFMDELIAMLAGVDKIRPTYNNSRSLECRGHANLLLHREV